MKLNLNLDRFSVFRLPSPAELMAKEIDTAERELLSAQTAVEYAQSVVSYNQARLTRLRKDLAKAVKEKHDAAAQS